jgi:protease-4
MTPAERAQIQSLIDDFHARFLEVVARGRPALAPEAVARLADGRVYSARQAKEAGLVDEIAYLPEAVEETKRRAGLTEARVVVYHRPREWRENLYSVSAPAPPRAEGAAAADALARALRAGPAFLYLWWPGLAD